jgi:hypothetical protein
MSTTTGMAAERMEEWGVEERDAALKKLATREGRVAVWEALGGYLKESLVRHGLSEVVHDNGDGTRTRARIVRPGDIEMPASMLSILESALRIETTGTPTMDARQMLEEVPGTMQRMLEEMDARRAAGSTELLVGRADLGTVFVGDQGEAVRSEERAELPLEDADSALRFGRYHPPTATTQLGERPAMTRDTLKAKIATMGVDIMEATIRNARPEILEQFGKKAPKEGGGYWTTEEMLGLVGEIQGERLREQVLQHIAKYPGSKIFNLVEVTNDLPCGCKGVLRTSSDGRLYIATVAEYCEHHFLHWSWYRGLVLPEGYLSRQVDAERVDQLSAALRLALLGEGQQDPLCDTSAARRSNVKENEPVKTIREPKVEPQAIVATTQHEGGVPRRFYIGVETDQQARHALEKFLIEKQKDVRPFKLIGCIPTQVRVGHVPGMVLELGVDDTEPEVETGG